MVSTTFPSAEDHASPDAGQDSRGFSDGSTYRIEISSVENPAILKAVADEAARRHVRVHRVSQGSGASLLTRSEISTMVQVGRDLDIEVCIWAGERDAWGVGAQSRCSAGAAISTAVRGERGLQNAVDEVRRAVDAGVRSFLIADLGLMALLAARRSDGDLPSDLFIKSSVSFPVDNPETAKILEGLGVGSINLPVDLSLSDIAGIRSSTRVPLDIYVESPDEYGGVVRHADTLAIVQAAAPVYLKYAVRNARPQYPAGMHTLSELEGLARERVRRAQIGLELLEWASQTSNATRAGVN
jgi:hypothetical protein